MLGFHTDGIRFFARILVMFLTISLRKNQQTAETPAFCRFYLLNNCQSQKLLLTNVGAAHIIRAIALYSVESPNQS